jgi:PAS domain S-box-containing protein
LVSRVYTLESSDLPYSTLVERMQQGAAMLDARGCIVYCNLSLAQLLGLPRETVIGRLLQHFLAPADQPSYQKLLHQTETGSNEGEMSLCLTDGRVSRPISPSVHCPVTSLQLGC